MTEAEQAEIPSPLEWLEELDHGCVADDINAEIAKAVDSSLLTGEPATVTIKIQVAHTGGQGSAELEVAAAVTAKLPKRGTKPSTRFVGPHGTISKRDPRQASMLSEDTRGNAIAFKQPDKQTEK